MTKIILLACLSFILHKAITEEDSTKLLLVQAVFRHGDRAPLFLYPTDPNKMDCFPEGLGKLSMLGKKQLYALGKFLRSMYQDFITSNPNEVSVTSSASHRCLTSAATLLASFYAPEKGWKFDDSLNWQPIPIHYLPSYQDKLLSFNAICPQVLAEQFRQLQATQELYQKYQVKFEELSNYAGLNVSRGLNAMFLYNTLKIEKTKNLTIPEWVDLYWNELEEAALASFRSITSSPLILRLRVGPLLQDISQNIENKINGKMPDLKVQLYSGHDVNMMSIFMALNFTNMQRPPYCATLLFELHEMADTSKTVRLLYLNSTDPLADMGEPQVLILDDCSEFCPVEIFTQKLQHFIPENWKEECKLNTSDAVGNNIFRVSLND